MVLRQLETTEVNLWRKTELEHLAAEDEALLYSLPTQAIIDGVARILYQFSLSEHD